MTAVPPENLDIVEMSDSDVRRYIRSGKIRGSRKDLMKEAELFLADKNESGLGVNEYAKSIGMDRANVSRILSRNNVMYQETKRFISQTMLPASVVDEIIKTKPDYTLSYLREAELNQWSTEKTRDTIKHDITPEGESVIEKPKGLQTQYVELSKDLPVVDRAAVCTILDNSIGNLTKLEVYFNGFGAGKFKRDCELLVKRLVKLKSQVEGSRVSVPSDTTKELKRSSPVKDWMLEGGESSRRRKVKDISKRIDEILGK